MSDWRIPVTYLELRTPPSPPRERGAGERVALERLDHESYLALYRRVGEPLRWDQRLRMSKPSLAALLAADSHRVYVVRTVAHEPIGFCEFDARTFPDVELQNFGLIPAAQGRGIGPWLLAHALCEEWRRRPHRIWLHTDIWDHPAAIATYQRAGFVVTQVRDEDPESL